MFFLRKIKFGEDLALMKKLFQLGGRQGCNMNRIWLIILIYWKVKKMKNWIVSIIKKNSIRKMFIFKFKWVFCLEKREKKLKGEAKF